MLRPFLLCAWSQMSRTVLPALAALAFASASPVFGDTLTVTAVPLVEWKAVFGQVEARDSVPARARIGGTVVSLDVTEGDRVEQGQQIARVVDDKLQFRIDSLDAQLAALGAQRVTAQSDLDRGRALLDRGVTTNQKLDQLQTAVDVIEGQIRSMAAERLVVEQQIAEGAILAPDTGVVVDVPISRGSVVNPGEAAAVIAGGGVFLRLSVPERHTADLTEGAEIEIGGDGEDRKGRLVKLYPRIAGGRVQADVEVENLDGRFVGRRIPVRLPVGARDAILVPADAVTQHGGLDFVTVEVGGTPVERAVVPGGTVTRDGSDWVEILTGLTAGEILVTSHD